MRQKPQKHEQNSLRTVITFRFHNQCASFCYGYIFVKDNPASQQLGLEQKKGSLSSTTLFLNLYTIYKCIGEKIDCRNKH